MSNSRLSQNTQRRDQLKYFAKRLKEVILQNRKQNKNKQTNKTKQKQITKTKTKTKKANTKQNQDSLQWARVTICNEFEQDKCANRGKIQQL